MNTTQQIVEAEFSEAKQRVLDVAERLFMEKGYATVTLRDIADELGIRQASLYYHFPDGKEQLFLAVAERVFANHNAGMVSAIIAAAPEIRAQLLAVCAWFESQPAINFMGMMYADMPALSAASARQLADRAYRAMFDPLRTLFATANARGETRAVDPDILAGSFLALMDGITFSLTVQSRMQRTEMASQIVDLIVDGLRHRS